MKAEKNYLYFGTYPQSLKSVKVKVGKRTDENGYYTGSDGGKYAQVGGEYFKVEPIKWKILQEHDGTAFLLSEFILANMAYHSSNSDYANSAVRDWLNKEFYRKAFSETEKRRIVTTTVENSDLSTGYPYNPYSCADSQDNAFLLSYQEAFESLDLTDRRKRVTAYAEAIGAYVNHENHYGYWWLRSPNDVNVERVRVIDSIGYAALGNVFDATNGVAPALWIKL